MERIEHHVCFGGSQEVWRHHSAVTGTPMTFSVFRRRRQKQRNVLCCTGFPG
nr:S-formylglutathione hydrolase [Enterobacter cloacae complex sp.]